MNGCRAIILLIFLSLSAAAPVLAADHVLFGPTRYNVKDRYGKVNKYTGAFTAGEGLYLIEFKNGDELPSRVDWMEFTLNGERVLSENKYGYRFLAAFLNLKKENTFEIVLKDDKPSGFVRPALPPRFVIMSVMTVPQGTSRMLGVFGFNNGEFLKPYADIFSQITSSDAFSLAMQAADLRLPPDKRAAALRKLTDLKERSAESYLVYMFSDVYCIPEIRGEAAFALAALGDEKFVPLLLGGLMDPDEKVSIPTARALSFYPESVTGPRLITTLERLDYIRKDAVVQSIVSAGWKPVSTIVKLAESSDPQTSNMAVKLLGKMNDPRATDLLLRLLDNAGSRDMKVIITALGDTKDPRVVDPLLKLAQDREKRRGKEAELGEALVKFGDKRAVAPITDMIEKVETRQAWDRLRESYKKLTGKEYKD
jgi:hypothetical protein